LASNTALALDAVPRTNTNIDLRVPPLAELHARLNFGTSAEMVDDMVQRMAGAVLRRPAR